MLLWPPALRRCSQRVARWENLPWSAYCRLPSDSTIGVAKRSSCSLYADQPDIADSSAVGLNSIPRSFSTLKLEPLDLAFFHTNARPMPRIKPPPFVRVLAGQRAAARTRSVPAQISKHAAEGDEMLIESKGDVMANTWATFRTRRAGMPRPEEDKEDKEGPNEDEAVRDSKRKAEWKRRQGVRV